jgi:hypothetical protein
MSRKPPSHDIDESELDVRPAKDQAAGPTAVAVTMKRAIEQMGLRRATSALRKLNQVDGFDCQGCAWPDPAPGHRHIAEFCENGGKAVSEEATRRHIGHEFFAAHPLVELEGKTDYWLGQQGRIIEPMVLRPGGSTGLARLQGRRQQHPDLEVGDHPAREAGGPAYRRHRRRRRPRGRPQEGHGPDPPVLTGGGLSVSR